MKRFFIKTFVIIFLFGCYAHTLEYGEFKQTIGQTNELIVQARQSLTNLDTIFSNPEAFFND